jgi:hypothetical protein
MVMNTDTTYYIVFLIEWDLTYVNWFCTIKWGLPVVSLEEQGRQELCSV